MSLFSELRDMEGDNVRLKLKSGKVIFVGIEEVNKTNDSVRILNEKGLQQLMQVTLDETNYSDIPLSEILGIED